MESVDALTTFLEGLSSTSQQHSGADDAADAQHSDLLSIEHAIIESIAQTDAFVRSQQINDPDIELADRRRIITRLWHRGPRPFLERFRQYLSAEQLTYFDARSDYPSKDLYEIRFYLADARERLTNRRRDVRNRRFAAMQRMMAASDCSYFEEAEMMAREPLLYERLIGQYMTDGERRQRDRCDGDDGIADESDAAAATAAGQFSRVLLDGIARDHVTALRRQQEQDLMASGSDDIDDDDDADDNEEEELADGESNGHSRTNGMMDDDNDEEYYPQVPPSFHQHWGDFEDDDRSATSGSAAPRASSAASSTAAPNPVVRSAPAPKTTKTPDQPDCDRKQKYVNASEKEVLCDEFYAAMYESFLDGRDRDFDYTQVDDNAEYDDLEQLDRDKEAAYFDADDGDDDDGDERPRNASPMSNESSEDELEKYMNGIREAAL